jgi:CPA2 family monovalent cation:H+ antiporter-2
VRCGSSFSTALGAIVIAGAAFRHKGAALLAARLSMPERSARMAIIIVDALLAVPFGIGIVRLARRIGQQLAVRALPAVGEGQVDLAAAPRRVLVVALQLAIVLVVGIPLVALTQPFLPPFEGIGVLAVVLAALGVAFWRSATNLEGHVRAGAQMIAEALARQTYEAAPHPMAEVDRTLPGLGHPTAFRVPEESPADGRTLRELDLRGRTGAAVLAIRRGERDLALPGGEERVLVGDVLALAGSDEAIAAACALLARRE